MSIYYYYINRTKHEYFSSGDMGYGLKEYAYRQDLLPLLGYLCMNDMYTGDVHHGRQCKDHKPKNKDHFPLQGHWYGDDYELISEYDRIYDEIWDSKRLEGYSGPQWTNISKQLWEEYNAYIKYWNDLDVIEDKEYREVIRKNIEKMSIPIGSNGAHFEDE
jgi:hypothetical protein